MLQYSIRDDLYDVLVVREMMARGMRALMGAAVIRDG
jgi:hypothetical protein